MMNELMSVDIWFLAHLAPDQYQILSHDPLLNSLLDTMLQEMTETSQLVLVV